MSIRKKLALFAAASVVFAPGWGARDDAAGPRPTVELAARILAPTFDEASIRQESPAHSAVDRGKQPILPKGSVAAAIRSVVPLLEQVGVAAAGIWLLLNARPATSSSPRAPPLPLIV